MTKSVLLDARTETLLDRLYRQHDAQGSAIEGYFTERFAEGSLDPDRFDDRTHPPCTLRPPRNRGSPNLCHDRMFEMPDHIPGSSYSK